jgi:predicted nucleic acid-binding protein
MEIVVDTSVLVGLLDDADLWHAQARDLIASLHRAGHTGVYLDCVLAETISVVIRRAVEKGRQEKVGALYDRLETEFPADRITWILPDVPALYVDVLSLMRSSSGELNFNDGLISLSCRERGISAIASFDADFDRVAWLKRLSRPEDAGQISS